MLPLLQTCSTTSGSFGVLACLKLLLWSVPYRPIKCV